MRDLRSLDYSDARAAVDAGLAEAAARGLAMGFAVTDHSGELLLAARMDGVPARVLRHAIRKAFTCAEMGRNTLVFSRDLAERGGTLEQWGNPELTTLQGGLVVRDGAEVLGGVACGGGPLDDDEAVARVMVRAMGFKPVEDSRATS